MTDLMEFSVGRAIGASVPGFMRGMGVVCGGVEVNQWVFTAASGVGGIFWRWSRDDFEDGVKDIYGGGGGYSRFCAPPCRPHGGVEAA